MKKERALRFDPLVYDISGRFRKEHLGLFSKETKLAMQVVLAAGSVLRSLDRPFVIAEKEGQKNLTTNFDLASEKAIVDRIEEACPRDKILTEEKGPKLKNPLSYPRLWVIDPIDGSANVEKGRYFYAISAGFLNDGVPFSGAIFDPVSDELFYSEIGVGAFKNGQEIKVGNEDNLKRADVVTDLGFLVSTTHTHLEMLKRSGAASVQMRGSSILSMAWVACGRFDLFFYTQIKPWDNAAAFAIIRAAGGVVKGVDGREIDIMSKDVVVGNGELVKQFVEAVR